MAFTEDGKFYHDRRLDHSDTWKMASETLAYRIETYLFAEDAPGYLKPEFLSWALSVYDATKNSSGNIEHGLDDWNPDDPTLYLTDVSDPKTMDRAIRYSDDAHKAAGLNTDAPPEPVDFGIGTVFPHKDEPVVDELKGDD